MEIGGTCTLFIVLLLATATNAQPEGKWSGYFEAPGSIAAIRLNIAGDKNALTMNVYGVETFHPISDLTHDGEKVSFTTEISGQKFTFAGRLHNGELRGVAESAASGGTLRADWKVRRFDDSKLVKTSPIAPRGLNMLARPTGRSAIGRRTFYWTDETRPEMITVDPSDKRTMLVQVWYPAEKNSGTGAAPYIDHLEEMYTKASNLTILRTIKTHAKTEAAPARSKAPFPLIVFTPGLGSRIWAYTGVIENLVSHGYAVAAINPGHDAGDYKMPDVSYLSELWDQPVSATWTAEKRRAFFDERRRGWAGDMSFALDRLAKLDGDLTGKLDTANAAALGHSFGGQAVSIACANDKRFKACANLDGLAQGAAFLPAANGENLKQPFAFFSKTPVSSDYELHLMGMSRSHYDTRERRRMLNLWKPSLKTRLAALGQGTYFIVVRGATHQSFGDTPLLEADPKTETLASRLHRAQVINEYILAFFDRFIRSRPNRLLDQRDSSRPSVVVEFLTEK